MASGSLSSLVGMNTDEKLDIELIATSATLVSQVKLRDPTRGFEPKSTLRNFELVMGLRQNEPALLDKMNAWIDVNIASGTLKANNLVS